MLLRLKQAVSYQMIIALHNIKGGVGKTSCTVNLAYLSAKKGLRTLLCDLDPQGASTFYLQAEDALSLGASKLAKGKKLDSRIVQTAYENLSLLPADLSYRELDVVLSDMKKSRKRLKQAFAPLEERFDVIFLDCPPNVTLLSENIFRAADVLLVPLIPAPLSMMTYRKLVAFFEQERLDPRKIVPFFSMVEPRKRMHRDTMQQFFDESLSVFNSYIPFSSVVEQMGQRCMPVHEYSKRSKAARSFEELWTELDERIGLKRF